MSCARATSFSCSLLSALPGTQIPDRSPFTSAQKTGTPASEKPWARICKVTVLPVPVAPATTPWRLARFSSSRSGAPSKDWPRNRAGASVMKALLGAGPSGSAMLNRPGDARKAEPRLLTAIDACLRHDDSPPMKLPITVTQSSGAANAVAVIAVVAAGAALYWLRDILTPLAMAVFLMIMIDGVKRSIERRTLIPSRFAGAAALILVV